MQALSWVITLVLVGVLGLLFMYVAVNAAHANTDYADIQKRTYTLRTKLFFIVLIVLVPVVAYSFTQIPYAKQSLIAKAAKTVNVVAHQWYWEINDLNAIAGEPVLYQVTSADVNHGFAIYKPDLSVLAQTQAMPKYTNQLIVTFPEAGVYKILCLEYCGLAHHAMLAEINVTKR